MPISNDDLINSLIKITPESNLNTARDERSSATENTQLAFNTIFSTPSALLTQDVKYEFAHLVAQQTGSLVLAHFYKELIKDASVNINTAALLAAKNYLLVLVHSPKKTNYDLIHSLIEQGWDEANIILLAQLITFVTYQARLVEGLLLLEERNIQSPTSVSTPITAGHWNINVQTHQGLPAPTAFTQDQLGWASWLKAREQQTLSSDETLVMKKFGQLNSEYFLLLAHQSKILEIRTLIDRSIFYTSGGLPRWEREFAAAVVSKVNGCIYCASVHARKASQYAKDRKDDVNQLLATPTGEILATGFDKRLTAITDLSASLSATPIQATHQQIKELRQLGLSELELLDLIQSTAFFSWANRLMLSLGEPFELIESKESTDDKH